MSPLSESIASQIADLEAKAIRTATAEAAISSVIGALRESGLLQLSGDKDVDTAALVAERNQAFAENEQLRRELDAVKAGKIVTTEAQWHGVGGGEWRRRALEAEAKITDLSPEFRERLLKLCGPAVPTAIAGKMAEDLTLHEILSWAAATHELLRSSNAALGAPAMERAMAPTKAMLAAKKAAHELALTLIAVDRIGKDVLDVGDDVAALIDIARGAVEGLLEDVPAAAGIDGEEDSDERITADEVEAAKAKKKKDPWWKGREVPDPELKDAQKAGAGTRGTELDHKAQRHTCPTCNAKPGYHCSFLESVNKRSGGSSSMGSNHTHKARRALVVDAEPATDGMKTAKPATADLRKQAAEASGPFVIMRTVPKLGKQLFVNGEDRWVLATDADHATKWPTALDAEAVKKAMNLRRTKVIALAELGPAPIVELHASAEDEGGFVVTASLERGRRSFALVGPGMTGLMTYHKVLEDEVAVAEFEHLEEAKSRARELAKLLGYRTAVWDVGRLVKEEERTQEDGSLAEAVAE